MLRITKTENGMVKGVPGSDARITVFKGVPFAAPPVGDLRWKAPQPCENWEGIRECFDFAPVNMQAVPGKDPEAFYSKEWHVDPEVPMSEDSLYLNIWTNAKTGKEKMPVYVWIFGGGLKEGYAYEMEFDGERMASRDVVVVTVAYRLNIFGFLSHPDLTKEDPSAPANFGFLDQQAAIRWVKRNIENFGGDPDNITVGGQSAGGISVFAQMCAPSNKGLFQKAIVQSSAGGSVPAAFPKGMFRRWINLEAAEQDGKEFLENVLGVKTIEEARKLDTWYIRDKVAATNHRFRSIVDNAFMYKDIVGYVFSNEINEMPLLLGYTGAEMPVIAEGNTLDEVKAWTKDYYSDIADDMLKLWSRDGDDAETVKKASVANANEISTRLVAAEYDARGKDIYCYKFDPEMPGDDAGSFHSSDLWFTFETLMKCWRPFDGHHYDLSRKMCNYWTNFMKYGDPNGNDKDGTPMAYWPKYTNEKPYVLQFFDEISLNEEQLTEQNEIIINANLERYRKTK